jgi:8-oxo-dGTP diphosphatase
MTNQHPVPCVGVVLLDGDNVLLIRRGKPPREGQWSIPGGRQEVGETLLGCAIRETLEETGLSILPRALVDALDLIDVAADGSIERHYTLIDYWAELVTGDLVPGDDAVDARWFPLAGIGALGLWDRTLLVIEKAVLLRQDARAQGITE